MPKWKFITRHGMALVLISKHPKITALDLATTIGLTERAVRRIIAVLYAADYIEKKKVGRGLRYRVNHAQTLRHDIFSKVPLADLLEALGGKRPYRQASKINLLAEETD